MSLENIRFILKRFASSRSGYSQAEEDIAIFLSNILKDCNIA
jgi:hypothetical protein